MRYSTFLPRCLLLAIAALSAAVAAHFFLDAGLWEADKLRLLRFWSIVSLCLLVAGAGGYAWNWHKRWQRPINQWLGRHGRVYSLAPYTRQEFGPCDIWRRLPAAYLPRAGERPPVHLAWEMSAGPEQSIFSFCLPPAAGSEQVPATNPGQVPSSTVGPALSAGTAPDELERAILSEISREWPRCEIRPMVGSPLQIKAGDEGEIFADPPLAAALDRRVAFVWQTFKLARADVYPLHSSAGSHGRAGWDPGRDQLAALLGALDAVHPEARGGIQALIRPAPPSVVRGWERRANRLRAQLYKDRSRAVTGPHGEPRIVPVAQSRNPDQLKRELEMISARLENAHAVLEVCFRVWAASRNPAVAEAERQRLAAGLMGALRGVWNELKPDQQGSDGEAVAGRHYPARGGIVLTAAELGQILHLPGAKEAAAYPRLHQAGAEPLPPERRIRVEPGQEAGRRVYGRYRNDSGDTVLVGHAFDHSRTHTFISGATGSGKSTCAENLIGQDWQSGAGVLVLDPHGALVDDLLRHLPESRRADVLLLDAGGPQPFRFNLCAVGRRAGTGMPDATATAVSVEYILEAIAVSENASWESNVNMRDILHHALLLALDTLGERACMLSVQKLLEDGKWRATLLKEASFAAKPAVDFWQGSFARMHRLDRDRALNAAVARVRTFTKPPVIRRTLGMAGQTFDLAAELERGALILVPMPDSLGEDGKRLLGALLVREFLTALMRRDPSRPARRACLFIDELAATVGTMAPYLKRVIAELRKYHAAATLMTQSYAALPRDLQELLKGQCATQLCFRGAAGDARAAAELLGHGVSEEDVLNLRPYHAYARLGLGGAVAQPCLLRMLPPPGEMNRLKSQPPVNGRPAGYHQPPPAEWAPLLTQAAPAPLPASGSYPAPLLLAHVERHLSRNEKEMMDILRALQPEELAALRATKRAFDRWRLAELQANPGRIADPVARQKTLSQLATGVPWWLSEVAYQKGESGLEELATAVTGAPPVEAPVAGEAIPENVSSQRSQQEEVQSWPGQVRTTVSL
jgi:hypothetical protein